MMTDDQILEVVQAHKEGKKIEFRFLRGVGTWGEALQPVWNFECVEYRVAPEPRKPREYWLIKDQPESLSSVTFRAYPCRQRGIGWEQIHVREVIE